MLDPLGPKLFLTLLRGTNATTIIPSDPLCTLSLIFVVHRDPMSWSLTYAFDTYSSNLSLHAVYIHVPKILHAFIGALYVGISGTCILRINDSTFGQRRRHLANA